MGINFLCIFSSALSPSLGLLAQMAIKTFLSIRLGAFLWIHVHLLFAHFQLVTHIVDAAGSFLDFSLG